MKIYKNKFVQIVCNISQFVQIKSYLFAWLFASIFISSVLSPAFAQDDGSGSGSGGGGGDSGDGGGTPPDPPPELMTWGTFYCNIFSRLLWVWPATPDGMRLADLASSLAATVPFVGDQLVYLIFRDLFAVLSLITMIKLVKVLPAKF
jgi:hypothetical protein